MTHRAPLRRYKPLAPGRPLVRYTQIRRASTQTTGESATRTDTGPSRKVRALVLARDGYACVCCGKSVIGQRYSLQHRKRRSQGGGNSPSNLITVLGDGTSGCHARIDSRIDPHDEAQGYTVRSWDDPAMVPVMFHGEHGSGFLARLADDGGLLFEDPAAGAA